MAAGNDLAIMHVIFEPLVFLVRLAGLVPKPKVNLTRPDFTGYSCLKMTALSDLQTLASLRLPASKPATTKRLPCHPLAAVPADTSSHLDVNATGSGVIVAGLEHSDAAKAMLQHKLSAYLNLSVKSQWSSIQLLRPRQVLLRVAWYSR